VFEGAANSESGTIYGALNLESATGGHVSTPLASTRVRLTAPGYADDVATDADGIFVAFGVPPGTVTMTPLMTDQLAVTNRALLSMKVVGGQCTSVDLLAAPNGRIRGRIVGPDGKPRSGLPLHLVRSEPQWDRRLDERYTVTTDERGEYEFSAIPPGSYLLGHQIIGPHLVMPSQTLPPKTYYPGSADAAGANPIVVGNATQHDGIDFVVEHTGP
jgi:hypothetical protein